MGQTRLIVPEGLTCMALREFLQKECGFSTTLWKKLRRSGTFSLNGLPANAARTRIKSGDELCWHLAEESRIASENIPLDILYEDAALLIVNKPAGMLVHPTGGEYRHTLANAVLFHYEAHGEKHAFHPVHRLDRQTSGLVLIAKESHVQHASTSPSSKANCPSLAARLLRPSRAAPAASSSAWFPLRENAPSRTMQRLQSAAGFRFSRFAWRRDARIRSASTSRTSLIRSSAMTSTAAERIASPVKRCTPIACAFVTRRAAKKSLYRRLCLQICPSFSPKSAVIFLFSQKIHDAFIKL